MMKRLIPKLCCEKMDDGLDPFVNALGVRPMHATRRSRWSSAKANR